VDEAREQEDRQVIHEIVAPGEGARCERYTTSGTRDSPAATPARRDG